MPAPTYLEMENKIAAARLAAVLVIKTPALARPLLETLVESGITTVEVAWRTEGFLPMLRDIRRDFPGLYLGVGTVLAAEQVQACIDAGADFGLSPGISRTVVEAAGARHWPFIPGVMTPSEIQLALELDCRLLKFFPAETSGGLKHLKTMSAPFLHLRPRYIVLGGIGPDNVAAYAAEPLVAAIGGSWIAPSESIEAQDWKGIAARAKQAVAMLAT